MDKWLKVINTTALVAGAISLVNLSFLNEQNQPFLTQNSERFEARTVQQPSNDINHLLIEALRATEGVGAPERVKEASIINAPDPDKSLYEELATVSKPTKDLAPSSSEQVQGALESAIPNYCDFFYCKEGDEEVYPLSLPLAAKLNTRPSFVIGDKNSNGTSLVVVFDPTCPSCKALYRTTISRLISEGHSVRIIPTLYHDKISSLGTTLVQSMLCAEDRVSVLEKIATNKPVDRAPYECTIKLDATRALIEETKRVLAEFSLDGVTPLVFTPTAMWFTATDYATTKRYLEMDL